ncbi:MAG: hypothetical protein E6713_14080 [Sporomusaceae bacterium]|nr:hypothetical protein [Sporomusaceae bacterium]
MRKWQKTAALWDYFIYGKGRRDGLDYLKAGLIIVFVMVLCFYLFRLFGV